MLKEHYIKGTKKARGVSVIELIMAVALLSILLAVGVPSFSNLIESNHLVTKNNLFVSDLNAARSEAIKRGRSVSLCKSTDGASCSTDATVGYEAGWIMFAEETSLGARDAANEALLRVQPAIAEPYTLRGSARFTSFISYLPSGELANAGTGSAQDHFILCKDNMINKARAVFVSPTGRVHLARDTNKDGTPENTTGTPLTTCTPPSTS